MNLRDTYNKIAADWNADHRSDDWWVDGTDIFCSLLNKGDTVLDVGCGSGFKADYLAKKNLRVTGIDFSEKLIEIAKNDMPQVEFFVMDMKDVRKLGQKFNGIFAQASLLHIRKKDILATIKGLEGVLKPGGYLYIAVKGIQQGKPEESILEENNYGYPYSRFFSYYSIDELRGYLKSVELDLVYENSKRYGKTDWIQVMGRKS